jgi:hypothetical protein
VLAGRTNRARCRGPRCLLAAVVQVPLTRSRRSTIAPGLLNGAATLRRSFALPATSESVTGAFTVTVIAALCAPPGPPTRKTSAVAGGTTENENRPSFPVAEVAATCHVEVPCARSSRRTFTCAAARPWRVTFPVNLAKAPAGNWTRATLSLTA